MKITLTDAQVDSLADTLQGTTLSLEQGLAQIGYDDVQDGIEELSPPSLDALDTRVFLCSVCGWWSSTDELAENEDDEVCDECAEDQDDD